jgi:thioesterase domain-containing protein
MAEDYASLIREQQQNGPYLLLGHSFGGLLAALIANVLERDGAEVAFLGLVDSLVPGADVIAPSQAGLRGELITYLEVIMPTIRIGNEWLAGMECDSAEQMRNDPRVMQAVRELIEAHSADAPESHLGMSAEEILNAFLVRQRLTHIAMSSPPMRRLVVQAHCWSIASRSADMRQALRDQLQAATIEHGDIEVRHEDIIDHPRFLADIVGLLGKRGT